MKKYYIILIAGLLCLTACNKEDKVSEEQNPGKITYIKAKNGDNDSKASVDNTSAAFTWNTGDKVAVYTTDGYKISNDLDATYDGTNAATFAFSDMEETHRTDFALFPASLVWNGTSIRPNSATNHSASSLTVTLPASYTLSEVQDEVSPVPMIATNTPNGDLNFKSLCALLRITVQNVPYMAKRLEFDFNGNKVQGEFTLSGVIPGNTSITTSSTEGADDIITVTMADNRTWHDALIINLAVPTGEYTNITISAYDATSGGNKIFDMTRPVKTSANWVAGRKASRKITAALPVYYFSVGSKRVIFAPGNLQATTSDFGSHWTWHFAANQWDFMGNKTGSSNVKINGNGTVSANGTVDLFAWVGASNTSWSGELGTTGNAAMHGITNATTMGNATDYGNTIAESLKSEWGETINDGNIWRTLNKDEWTHLLSSRSGGTANGTSKARHTFATITDLSVDGFILFPDGVTIGADEVISWGNINGNSNSTKTQCTSAQWTALELKGCVFLPATGHRRYFSSKWELVSDNYYWSSSYRGGTTEQAVAKGLDNITGEGGVKRQRGCAVRLVHNVN